MGSKADYLENKVLEHVLKNTSYTSPVTVYCALFTVAPTDAGGDFQHDRNQFYQLTASK